MNWTGIVIPLFTALVTIVGLMTQMTKDDKDDKRKKPVRILLFVLLAAAVGLIIFHIVTGLLGDRLPGADTAGPTAQPTGAPLSERARIQVDPTAHEASMKDTYTSDEFLEDGIPHIRMYLDLEPEA